MSYSPETSLRWMHAALESATDGILIETAEHVAFANDAYAEMLGYRRSSELVHRPVSELIADSDSDRLLRFGRLRALGKSAPSSYEFAALARDGSAVRLQASVSLSLCGRTPYITTIVRPLPVSPDGGGPLPGLHDQISARERQVLQMLLDGKRPKMIAMELGLTENTVATHRTRLLQKLGLSDTRELFQYALRHRLIDWS